MSGQIYFKDGTLIDKSGKFSVYELEGHLYLETKPGHTLISSTHDLKNYIWSLGSRPTGDCLEIGLGLGVSSRYILSCPKVKSLTTVEIEEDIISLQRKVNFIDDKRHLILNCDGLPYCYSTDRKYDFVYLDFYSGIDDDTLPMIGDMLNAVLQVSKSETIITGWCDPSTPEDYVSVFYNLVNQAYGLIN